MTNTTVTINMTLEEYEYVKQELLQAEQDTFVFKREGVVIDRKKVDSAHAHIEHVLNQLHM